MKTILARRPAQAAGWRQGADARMARCLRPLPLMTQARNATARNFSNLAGEPAGDAGQKTRVGWQALPGAADLETFGCR
ncbi:hypothetical protein [Brevundimonas sp.]|uniref:hypothetical protein n=1 Tax=Brevundimonas sp. TaxID=1871086 RepID=UPI0025BA4AE6|nr:hypothetical protein [Brevundimonas sp.]